MGWHIVKKILVCHEMINNKKNKQSIYKFIIGTQQKSFQYFSLSTIVGAMHSWGFRYIELK